MSQPQPKPPAPSEEDLPEFEDRAKPFLLKLGMVISLLVAFALSVKPIQSRLKHFQGLAAADRAEGHMLAQRYEEAVKDLELALRLAPTKPSVIRVAAQLLTKLSDDRALEFWQRLLTTPEGSRQDRLKYVEFAIAKGRTDLSGPELQSMLRVNSQDDEARRLFVNHHMARGNPSEAVSVARQWTKDAPTNDEAQLILGQLLMMMNDSALREEGHRLLMALSSGNSRRQEEAVNLLVGDPNLTPAEIQVLIRSLRARPGNGLIDRLRIAELQIRSEPEKRKELIDGLVSAARTAPAGEMTAVANWLERQGDSAALIRAIDPAVAQTNGVLLATRLLALAREGQAAEVEPFLANTNAPISGFQRHLLHATIAAGKGATDQVQQHLVAAGEEARENIIQLQYATQFAQRLGNTNAAVRLLVRLLHFPPAAAGATTEILRALEGLAPASAARTLAKEVAGQAPDSRTLQTEAYFYDLLLKENVSATRDQLANLLKAEPTAIRTRFTLALSELLLGKSEAALALLAGDYVDWETTGPRWKALRAAALGAAGQADAARAAAARIDTKLLRPEELEWIKSYL